MRYFYNVNGIGRHGDDMANFFYQSQCQVIKFTDWPLEIEQNCVVDTFYMS